MNTFDSLITELEMIAVRSAVTDSALAAAYERLAEAQYSHGLAVGAFCTTAVFVVAILVMAGILWFETRKERKP